MGDVHSGGGDAELGGDVLNFARATPGIIMSGIKKPTTHILESTPASVSSGVLDPSRPAALTIDAGDIVSYPNTWTQWGNQAKFGMSLCRS